jgi:hypothetical protein
MGHYWNPKVWLPFIIIPSRRRNPQDALLKSPLLWANFHSDELDTASALQWQSLKIVRKQTYKLALDFSSSSFQLCFTEFQSPENNPGHILCILFALIFTRPFHLSFSHISYAKYLRFSSLPFVAQRISGKADVSNWKYFITFFLLDLNSFPCQNNINN